MYRIDNDTAAAALPASTSPGATPDGYFTDGNPGGGVPATVVDAEWLNMVQEELAKVVTDAGLSLSKSNRGQVSAAITILAAAIAASQAQVEAASSNSVYVSPGRIKYSPHAAQCRGLVTATTSETGLPTPISCTVAAGVNVASCNKTARNTYEVAFTTALSSANYVLLITPEDNTGNVIATIRSRSTSGFVVEFGSRTDGDTGVQDPDYFSFAVFGDFA